MAPAVRGGLGSARGCRTAPGGFSTLELVLIASLVGVIMAMAIPAGAYMADEVRAGLAVRHLVTRIRGARLEAARRSRTVGLRFDRREAGFEFRMYADGNGDGLRSRDIGSGVDVPLGPPERLSDQFPGVDFGLGPGVPLVGEAAAADSADPIRLGRSDILSFHPLGSGSPGTLYVRSLAGQQYAIRCLGTTGRVRLWRFNSIARTWSEP